jgi:hypothetical protein
MNARVADASGWDRQRRYELTHEHLVVRLALTVGGSLAAAAASAMSWTHGLVSATGPLNDGRLDGDGMYTAVLALAVIGCATWYYARPEDLAARVGAALAGALLLFAIVDWNVASDDVETANHDAGLFAQAGVRPGIWVLLAGAIAAAAGALWTWRVDR